MDNAILQFLEGIRTDFGTFFAAFFSLFGESLFLVVLICLIYWLVDRKWGERLVVVSFSSMVLNSFLKPVVHRARPYADGAVSRVEIDNPLISTMELDATQSFPSGHSQMSAGMFFSTSLLYRKKWLWIVCPLLTLAVMWSRMYLGVHYLTDTLCGAALGIVFAVFWDFIYRKCEDKKYLILIIFTAISIVLTIIQPTKAMFEFTGMIAATAIALPIENKFVQFENATGVKNRIFRALVGIVCVGLVFGLFSFLPFAFLEEYGWKLVKYFLTVLTGALFVPFLFKKLKI
ncbi:MAG: phosphatase PAP2 family protein [Clostridia bacterium]|nr:phosphatase PAP2 family protein [Clostridia bacterium]